MITTEMVTRELFAFAKEMERAAIGVSDREEEKQKQDVSELLLTIADILHERGDIHGAIEYYERAMRINAILN